MEYSYNDNELLYLINDESEQYQSLLFNKYNPIIHNIALDYFKLYQSLGISFDDLKQEGYIGFYNAIKTFNNKDSLFFTYSILCIKRNIISYIRNYNKKGNYILTTALDDSYLSNIKYYDEDIFSSIKYEYNYNNYKSVLNFNENIIFELLLNGFSSKEISILLDLPIDKVYYLSYKMKRDIKKQINC